MRVFCWALMWMPAAASAGGVLVGQDVAVGVSKDGSLCDDLRTACLLYNPGTGTPMGSDMLLPGRPFESWAVAWSAGGVDHVQAAASPDSPAGIPLTWETGRRGAHAWADGTGEVGAFRVRASVDVPEGTPRVVATLRFEAKEAVRGMYVSRTVDSDVDVFANNDFQTTNYAVGEVVVASSRRPGGKVLALASLGGVGAVCTSWCTTPGEVRNGQVGPVDGDRVVGVVRGPFDLEPGEVLEVRFGYGLGTNGDEAEAAALLAAGDDLDGDGAGSDADCDDRDPLSAPGKPEIADGRDNDCDRVVDEGGPATDDDGDGFSEADGDCDDADRLAYPGAAPSPGVLDANCDGLGDEGSFRSGEPPEGWGAQDDPPVASGCDQSGASVWSMWLIGLMALRRRKA